MAMELAQASASELTQSDAIATELIGAEESDTEARVALHRVLIVDDARTVRLYYRQILERAGFEVVEAVNGLEGLERAAEFPPELLVVDINMPKMDGYSMLRAMRADLSTRSIPAIMISTEAQGRDASRAYDAGANVYLVKPVKPDQLRDFAQLLLGVVSS